MPIFRYPFFYNNYRNYYNRPIPYGSNNNLHINNEYRPENFESKPQENPNKPLEEKKLNDDNKKNNSKKQEDSNYFFELFGLKLYFDDVLLICLIFFLYQEGVKDDELFISLILLLLS